MSNIPGMGTLCKKAPLVPEMTFEFAQLPLMEASFRGATVYAPVPKAADAAPMARAI